jgi:hypothetical protein
MSMIPRIPGSGPGRRARCAVAALAAGVLPLATAQAASTNAVANSGFTAGLAHWSKGVVSHGSGGTTYPEIGVGAENSTKSGEDWSWMATCAKFQGTKPFAFIDAPSGAAGYIQQQIKVPHSPSKLTFRTWNNLQPTKVTVTIIAGGATHTVLTYTPPSLQSDSGSGCTGKRAATKSIKVSSFAGKTIILRLGVTSTGYDGTIADFDSFSLT